ncbi:MAG: hypothetical protein FH748_08140 [Balneolaceae bacterium]|nr:hypothetical protein [Balneolaceae bacterium]
MSNFLVSKCICQEKEFTEVKEYAVKHNISTVRELQEHNYCACKCGLCIPYLELMFKTGETEFEPGASINRKS